MSSDASPDPERSARSSETRRGKRLSDRLTSVAAWNAIWNNDEPTRWSAFTSYVNMIRTAWPFLVAVIFVLLIALVTSQGREALKYSGSLNYPGGFVRTVCTGLALFLFGAALHETTLRSINVYYPFTDRALDQLSARLSFARYLSWSVPFGIALFYLHNWINYDLDQEWWLGSLRQWVLLIAGASVFLSAIYDFTAPAWRESWNPNWLKAAERWVIRYLKIMVWVVVFAYTFSFIVGPVLQTGLALLQPGELDFGASAFSGFWSALIALVAVMVWTSLATTTLSMKRYYSNTNQFFVFREWRNALGTCFTGALLVFLVALAIRPGAIAGYVGPVATLLATVMAIAGFFGQLAYMNARRQSIPALLVVLGLAVLSGTMGASNYHNIQVQARTPIAISSGAAKSTDILPVVEAVDRWRLANNDPTEPAIIVLAEGGGIRAALHTAAIMACLDAKDPKFYGNVFAMSGVSGGAVGLGAFLSAKSAPWASHAGDQEGVACDFAFDASQALTPETASLPTVTSGFLQSDFFSPVLAGFMLRDFPLNVTLCTATVIRKSLCNLDLDRANVFEASFRGGFRNAIAKAGMVQPRNAPALGFLQAVESSSRNSPAPPIVIFNTFDVRSGQPAIVSNIRYGDPLGAGTPTTDPDWAAAYSYWNALDVVSSVSGGAAYLDVASAAHMSARFPLISPPGRLCPDNKDCDRMGAGPFIDGGYYDNSGAAGVQLAVEQLRRLSPEKPIVVLHIVYRGLPDDLPKARLPAFFDFAVPMNGVLKARGAHGQVPIEQLCRTIEGDVTVADEADSASGSVCNRLNAFLAEAPAADDGCFEVALPDTPSHFRWLRSPLQAKYGEVCDGRVPEAADGYMAQQVVLPLGWLLGDAGETILRRVDHQIPALQARLCPGEQGACWPAASVSGPIGIDPGAQ
ncbi:MAG: hypothetical protein AAF829_03500 [Pseudomonadota bacterium]